MKLRPALILSVLLVHGVRSEDFRTFTNAQGVTIRAALVSVANGQATIRREDGAQFTVPTTAFSAADQAFMNEWKPAAAPASGPNAGIAASLLNELMGQPFFEEASLWECPIEPVAARLKLRRESQTATQSSFRAYPNADFKVLGTRPFSVALYADEGKISGLSLVFANKGDLFGSKGGGELHFDANTPPAEAAKIVKTAMDKDLATISETLTAKLGASKKSRFGEGKVGRMNMQRWDWRDHAILLADAEGEYVGLQIVPAAFANAGGKSTRVPDSVIRARAGQNVLKSPNGDVVIQEIPMVDQGPKGYCVPATAERAMRYLGVAADMYILANAGETGYGGGTSVNKLLEGAGRHIKAKGRSFDSWQGEMSLRELSKHIDKGIPVIWSLYSTKDFNGTANRRTQERKAIGNWEAWKTKLVEETRDNKLFADRETGHVVLIIGYNKDTGEIAFSDSWGERYKERWITMKEAELVSQQFYYVVGF